MSELSKSNDRALTIKAPVQSRSRQTVEAIKKAALRLLEHSPSHKVSTDIIAHEAGVSIGSVYQFYANKESIFVDALQDLNAKLAEDVQNETDANKIINRIAEVWPVLARLAPIAMSMNVNPMSGLRVVLKGREVRRELSYLMVEGKDADTVRSRLDLILNGVG